jgi:hypothetical protein
MNPYGPGNDPYEDLDFDIADEMDQRGFWLNKDGLWENNEWKLVAPENAADYLRGMED